jgi:sulfane dehydrogenase subunit SoxC
MVVSIRVVQIPFQHGYAAADSRASGAPPLATVRVARDVHTVRQFPFTPPRGAMAEAAGARIPITTDPLNAETPLSALRERITPARSFYVRSHFPPPTADPDRWTVQIGGAVQSERNVSVAELRALGKVVRTVTLECAGNGRRRMNPVPPGTPWDLGAVGTARFGGASLRDLLLPLGIASDAVEVLFHGADADDESGYARSLPVEAALDPDTLLVWEMNGAPLPPEHGAPVRLVVPGWYAMASVKWLAKVEVITSPFTGRFQTEDYVYLDEPYTADGTPVRRIRVRSLITSPAAEQTLQGGPMEVTGSAWSGTGPVVGVQFSSDGGATWHAAEVEPASSPHAAQRWSAGWHPERPGRYLLIARATDAAGNRQPLEPRWNRLGYGNNACHRVPVTVR